MKKLIIILSLFTACFSACANDTVISADQLPNNVRTFVAKHFPDISIAYSEKDFDSYEVKLSNGCELEFTRNGNWEKVDCKGTPVPSGIISLIPASIGQYISANYPGASIVEISKDRDYDIELNNGIELEFSLKGNFIKVD